MFNKNENDAWSVNESLLQSYRSIFYSTQSIMLAVGAIMFEKNDILFLLIFLVSVLQIWFIFYRVIISRAIIVDFYKYHLYDYFDIKGNLINEQGCKKLNEKAYVSNRRLRQCVNSKIPEIPEYKGEEVKKVTNFRITRIKIDIILPATLTLIWLALSLYTSISMIGSNLL